MPIQNTDQVVEAQKGKPRAILYFQREQTQIVKELAGALRAQGKLANLVYASNFRGDADVESCHAVAIQADAPKAHKIAKAYRRIRPDTEQHFFNHAGQFVDAPEFEDETKFEMPVLGASGSGGAVEPTGPSAEEIAATKAALTADAETRNEDEATTEAPAEYTDPSIASADTADAANEAETVESSESEEGDDGGDKPAQS